MGFFESCFTWGRLASITGVLAVVVLFVGGIFTALSTEASCLGVGLYMILLALAVAGLEAPNLLLMCGFKEGASKKMEWIKGYYRAILYVVTSFGLFFCISASAILSFLLLFSSGFFHFLQWLGPRGSGGAEAGPQRYSELRSKQEDLLAGEDNDEDSGPAPSWSQQATDAAGKAVAAAAVSHFTKKIAEANPFASRSKEPDVEAADTQANPFAAPGATVPDSTDDPFLAALEETGEIVDNEDNPFAPLNR